MNLASARLAAVCRSGSENLALLVHTAVSNGWKLMKKLFAETKTKQKNINELATQLHQTNKLIENV